MLRSDRLGRMNLPEIHAKERERLMSEIILASASPRRKELLEQVGIQFKVVKSSVEEVITETEPDKVVMELSRQKAEDVAAGLNDRKDRIVIGADTIVFCQGKILGKPKDESDAFAMLEGLAGKSHSVFTGVTLLIGDRMISFAEETKVNVKDMTHEEIRRYIATKEPMDKAGSYGIQGRFAAFVSGIEGDYNNVVGLPVSRIYTELTKNGVDIYGE